MMWNGAQSNHNSTSLVSQVQLHDPKMTSLKAQNVENGHWNFEENTHTELHLPSELISEYGN